MPKNNSDPENPPLTGKELRASGCEQILDRIAAHKAKYAAQLAKFTPEQIIRAANAPPVARVLITDKTTPAEISTFI
jgi:hypothetical protein